MLIADVAALVAAAEAAMAKLARFLSVLVDDCTGSFVSVVDKGDSLSRSGSSSAETDDVEVVLSEAASVVTVVLSLLASLEPMIAF
jgi:hypothetical protein